MAILLMDLDHFKLLNDTHGHLIGDEVLRRVGFLIADSIRKMDIAGRFGGEEFIVYLSNVQSEYVFEIAEKIRHRVESEGRKGIGVDLLRPITISVGVAQGVLKGMPQEALEGLIKKADEALYNAKKGGRNRVVVSEL